MTSNWTMKNDIDGVPCKSYWQRSDEAYVWYDANTPYSNPENPNALFWIAFGPDQRPFTRPIHNSVFKASRRWKTPEAAMKAVDANFPLN